MANDPFGQALKKAKNAMANASSSAEEAASSPDDGSGAPEGFVRTPEGKFKQVGTVSGVTASGRSYKVFPPGE